MKMLNNVRALDLTNEAGFFCGKILARLGVEVIKIEKPGGDPARDIGPFFKDIREPEKSLYWLAQNESKKGITLGLETQEGQDILKKLVENTDFLIESYPVGYMEKLGLSYQILGKINPRLIMASITPFGQTGPYRGYKATDLVAMAMGGIMSMTGEPEGLPCRLDSSHAYCLAGTFAALATMIAYYHRHQSGEGQYIDVSITECVIRENYWEVPLSWELFHRNVQRNGARLFRPGVNVYTRNIWPCKDGHVAWNLFGGKVGANENKQLAKWLEDEGIVGEGESIGLDRFNFDGVTQEDIDRIDNHVIRLTLSHTKKDLEDQAIRRGIRMSAVNDVKDLYESSQLRYRQYWRTVQHRELPYDIIYPGQLFISNETETQILHRAPLIGEHNKEIYEGELGFDITTIANLKEKGVI